MDIRELNRRPLRSEIHHEIRRKILTSEFKPHDRLKDTSLALALGTSRTPVREALIRLEREGFLENAVGRGFRVRPLTSKEAKEIYPIICSLESLALQTSRPHSRQEIQELERILIAMEREGTEPTARIELDKKWHELLCDGCKNSYLQKLIEELKTVTYRYEFAFMEVESHAQGSVREHHEVINFLKKGDVPKATKALNQHWKSGMQTVLKNLATEEKRRAKKEK